MKRTICLLTVLIGLSFPALAQNLRNVVLYNLTDTDCGPCSCMDSIIRHGVTPGYPRTVVLAIHSPMMNSYFREYQGNEIFKTFNSKYEPSGFIDGLGYDAPRVAVLDSLHNRYLASPEAPVSIVVTNKVWDPVTRLVNLSMTFTNLAPEMEGRFWLNLFVTENGILHMHRIFTGCATPDEPHGLPFRLNYYNDHVTRKIEFFAHGDSLIGPVWPSQQAITRSFSVAIDTAWVPENCNIAMVVYKNQDSLYKSPVMQAITQNVTAPLGTGNQPLCLSGDEIRTIHPNPATSWVNIHLAIAKPGHCSVVLVDAAGRQRQTLLNHWCDSGLLNVEFNAEGMEPGIYQCVLNTAAGRSVKRLVIR